jgi:signal transduction histidine kinase
MMGNALKFSKPDVPPIINISHQSLDYAQTKNYSSLNPALRYFHIQFNDNGIGFKQDHSLKIFDMFQRLLDNNSYPGSGIGLALCKKIVFNHQGHIYANSELGKGSTFHILLPEHQ